VFFEAKKSFDIDEYDMTFLLEKDKKIVIDACVIDINIVYLWLTHTVEQYCVQTVNSFLLQVNIKDATHWHLHL
jgi:hypothetical protein